MKTVRDKGFIPVVITLETEEEASLIWHILNCNMGLSLDTYCEEKGIALDRTIKTDIWESLDEHYRPIKE